MNDNVIRAMTVLAAPLLIVIFVLISMYLALEHWWKDLREIWRDPSIARYYYFPWLDKWKK